MSFRADTSRIPLPRSRSLTSSPGRMKTGPVLVQMSLWCWCLGWGYESMTTMAPFRVKTKMFAAAVDDLNFASRHLYEFLFLPLSEGCGEWEAPFLSGPPLMINLLWPSAHLLMNKSPDCCCQGTRTGEEPRGMLVCVRVCVLVKSGG